MPVVLGAAALLGLPEPERFGSPPSLSAATAQTLNDIPADSAGSDPLPPDTSPPVRPARPARKLPRDPVQRRIVRSFDAFFVTRGDASAWGLDRRRPHEALAFLDVLDDAPSHGLDPAEYGTDRLRHGVRRALEAASLSPDSLRAVDRALTEAFITYAIHLGRGRVDTSAIRLTWSHRQRAVKPEESLAAVLEGRTAMRDAIGAIAPQRPEYDALRSMLPRYRALAAGGGWPKVPDGSTLRAKDAPDSARVCALEERLAREGFLDGATGSGRFDERIVEGVKRFQARHGLEQDGEVGKRTLSALNLSAEWRARQIELNLERWRWMPESLAPRRVAVQVPAYRLDLVDEDRRVLSMRVIVGRNEWETPVFADSMRYIVMNPYWNVPRNVAQRTLLAKVKADSAYIMKEGFEVFTGYGRDAETVDPATIDWNAWDPESFPYRLRQRPGDANALGRMKFMFPNRFDVYLHDTPSPDLFFRGNRSVSHGCIRIEKPMELAMFLFPNHEKWTRERFEATVGGDKERTAYLPKPVPVYILYFTAAVNEAGEIEFYEDIYRVDRDLDRLLKARRPS